MPQTTDAAYEILRRNQNKNVVIEYFNANPGKFTCLAISNFTITGAGSGKEKDIYLKNLAYVIDASTTAFDHLASLCSFEENSYLHSDPDEDKDILQLVRDRLESHLSRYQTAIIKGEENWRAKLAILKIFSDTLPAVANVYTTCSNAEVERLLRLLNDELSDYKAAVLTDLFSYKESHPQVKSAVSEFYLAKFNRIKAKALSNPSQASMILQSLETVVKSDSQFTGYAEAQFVLGVYNYDKGLYRNAYSYLDNARNQELKQSYAYHAHICEMDVIGIRVGWEINTVLSRYYNALPDPLAVARLSALAQDGIRATSKPHRLFNRRKGEPSIQCVANLYLGLYDVKQSQAYFDNAFQADSVAYIAFVTDKLKQLHLDAQVELRLLSHAVNHTPSGEVRFASLLFEKLLKLSEAHAPEAYAKKSKDYLSDKQYAKFALGLTDHFEVPVEKRVAVLEYAQTHSPKDMRYDIKAALERYRPADSSAPSQMGVFAPSSASGQSSGHVVVARQSHRRR